MTGSGLRASTFTIGLVFFTSIISGCATMRFPTAYKIDGKEVKEFTQLDDERALKLIALIYNTKCENWEENIARVVALDEYLGLIAKRKTEYIKKSGIFDIKYDRENLAAWDEDDLVKLYDNLIPKTESYYMDSAQELNELENARRIMYLTAVSAVARELKKRDSKRNVVMIAGQVISTVLMVALSMI